jgi:molybdenum cofactor guanylyltransferase
MDIASQHINNLLAVVLCGGESKRMGRDKGLLLKENTPWAMWMANKLIPFKLPVVFSINQRQWEAYSAVIQPGQLIIDSLTLPGPLKGLLRVHKLFPDKDLLLLACDMLDLDEGTIRKVIDCYVEEHGGRQRDQVRADGPDFMVYDDGQFVQPFCGIYTAGGLSRACATMSQTGISPAKTDSEMSQNDAAIGFVGQSNFSFQRLLGRGKTMKLMIDRVWAFKNYNSL